MLAGTDEISAINGAGCLGGRVVVAAPRASLLAPTAANQASSVTSRGVRLPGLGLHPAQRPARPAREGAPGFPCRPRPFFRFRQCRSKNSRAPRIFTNARLHGLRRSGVRHPVNNSVLHRIPGGYDASFCMPALVKQTRRWMPEGRERLSWTPTLVSALPGATAGLSHARTDGARKSGGRCGPRWNVKIVTSQ